MISVIVSSVWFTVLFIIKLQLAIPVCVSSAVYWNVTFLSISEESFAGDVNVTISPASAARFAASTHNGLKVGHTDSSGDPNLVVYGVAPLSITFVTPTADFDSDDDVDSEDFAVLTAAWLTGPGDDNWNPDCDISIPADNYIDMHDLDVFVEQWLAGCCI